MTRMPEKTNEKPPEETQLLKLLGMLGTVGFTVVAVIVLSFLCGLWLMERLNTGVLPVLLSLGAGIALSFFWVYRRCCTIMKIQGPKERSPSGSDRTP